MIVFIPCSGEECKPGSFDTEWLPRQCPACGQIAIIGHGRRRRPAHDGIHDWIRVRRGFCKLCQRTVTVLPGWCVPNSPYSLTARQEAVEQARVAPVERVAITCHNPDRIPDPSTIRRWLRRRAESLLRLLPGCPPTPTLLAWDWRAASRILIAESLSP